MVSIYGALRVNKVCILKTLVLEAIAATISFKSMSGNKEGVWNPVPVGVFDKANGSFAEPRVEKMVSR
ncbi:hypothetical protein ROHU_023547 [Labeo rohita]|uniref:Uncharacterized protein n=1 Tax=Labeo rohita TaxID=84645 RepID=A0A498MN84_LABRO|nr:hypothetical protein ROHU_023547 [Labeo rohita]